MPMSPERGARIQRIRALPRRLAAAAAGLDDAQLDTPYREGGWTPRQVVHHVADSHMNAYIRMRLLLTEEHPTLRPYDQDAWARLPDSRGPIATSLALIEALHDRWASLLEQVPADAWERTGHHPESGTVTLDGLLAAYADHGENHMAQITGLRRARGW